MIALGRVDIPTLGIDMKDAAAPVDTLVRLGVKAVVTAIVARDAEAGNIPRVVATEMARIGDEKAVVVETVEIEEVVTEAVVVTGADVVDAVVPTETHCEHVERMPRRSTEPPDRRFSCTAITSSCSNTSSGHCTSIAWTFRPSVPVPG